MRQHNARNPTATRRLASPHGLVLLPYWPYTFERHGAGSDAVVVTHWRPEGAATTFVDPLAAQSVPGIVDVEPGPDHPYWVIETGLFGVAWPAGFSITSDFEPFCLVGEHGISIHVQGPAHVADPDALVAVGQTVVARRTMAQDVQVLELAYEHEGESWWKGAYFLPCGDDLMLAFSAQSRESDIAAARKQRGMDAGFAVEAPTFGLMPRVDIALPGTRTGDYCPVSHY